jgi:hypothetical protein
LPSSAPCGRIAALPSGQLFVSDDLTGLSGLAVVCPP